MMEAREVVWGVCAAVTELCEHRVTRMGPQPMDKADWGDILDTIPVTDQRTRMAIIYAISERSLLETCVASWQEVFAAL